VRPRKLLQRGEPDPVTVERPEGASPIFLTCEHAGRLIPRALGTLGVDPRELRRHIAWDIGAAAVARGLSERLDATLVLQRYSRLVADCNRAPHAPDFAPALSEDTVIPGNQGLSRERLEARVREVFRPYHERIAAELDARAERDCVLVSVHSFTPVFRGVTRPWHLGVLYEHDARLAGVLLEMLEASGLRVGDNEPYRLDGRKDYSVPVHGQRRGIPHVELEIRQDLIDDEAGQREWAERLAELLGRGLARLAERGEL